jgi:N-methylhydantoinase A
MSWSLGIETGGTFTDLFMVGPDGQVFADKVPSTPGAPERAAGAALARALELSGAAPADVSRVLHGSTVAVNALIERQAPQPGLIATRGFRDMLFIGRQEKTHIYDMFYRKPTPFVERANVVEVDERVGADGDVVTHLDVDSVAQAVDTLVTERGVACIAVCLLHSYANSVHERAIADVIRERHPGVRVVLSSDVCPVHREFERASTTVINATLQPIVDGYLHRFETLLAEAGCGGAPLIMQANGGVLPVERTRQRPAGLFLSGPSAAVAGAAALARQVGLSSLITLDVGGTSTDICLITHGEVHETGHGGTCGMVQGHPLNMVMTDIVTIGAGGGSLAWVDDGGMLNVGPRSAGADPGPACYGRGGRGYTLTDAMLSLGLLADGAQLPGGIVLKKGYALEAAQPLMSNLDLSATALADSVYRIAIANMAEAIRSVTIRRGLDPRDYVLFACGGAGPLMACSLAQELEIAKTLVPPDPGVFSAFGLTAAGLRMDFTRAVEQGSSVLVDATELTRVMGELRDEARTSFEECDAEFSSARLTFTADARYVGQGFELRVPFGDAPSSAASAGEIVVNFHTIHAQRYGHSFETQEVELTAVRLSATAPGPDALSTWRTLESGTDEGVREIGMGDRWTSAAVVDRAMMTSNTSSAGPILIVEPTTSTYVPHGWNAETDEYGLLHAARSQS